MDDNYCPAGPQAVGQAHNTGRTYPKTPSKPQAQKKMRHLVLKRTGIFKGSGQGQASLRPQEREPKEAGLFSDLNTSSAQIQKEKTTS